MSTHLKLALNNAWANATLYSAVKRLDLAAFTAPRPGFFPSLAATLGHIWQVDLYYLDALEQGGRGRTVYDDPVPDTVGALAALQTGADMRLAAFCNGISHDALRAMVPTQRKEGVVHEVVGDLLLHLFQHQVHHRGQAHVQLSHAGIAPPQLDAFFLDHDRAPSAMAYWS